MKSNRLQAMSLAQAICAWEQSGRCLTNKQLYNSFSTVLRKYILPLFGFSIEDLKLNYTHCLEQVLVTDFLSCASSIFELFSPTHFPHLKIKTLKYYRYITDLFFNFLYSLDTIGNNSSIKVAPLPRFLPSQRSGSSSSEDKLSQPLGSDSTAIVSVTMPELSLATKEDFICLSEYAYEVAGVSESTFNHYLDLVLYFFGWLHYKQMLSLSDLSLTEVTDIVSLKNFINWGIAQKGNSFGWGINVITACIFITKFLNYLDGDDRYPLEPKQELLASMTQKYSSTSEISSPSLSFPEIVQVINYLRQGCVSNHVNGIPRSQLAILKSWQRYLIVSLLVYSPVRLNQLRQLMIDEHLILSDSIFYLDLSSFTSNTKTNQTMDMVFPLPSFLTQDLRLWINQLRPKVNTDHDFLFTKLGSPRCPNSKGQPLTLRDLSEMISNYVDKATQHLFGKVFSIRPQSLGRFKNNYLEFLGILESQSYRPKPQSTIDELVKQVQDLGDPYKHLGHLKYDLQQLKTIHKPKP